MARYKDAVCRLCRRSGDKLMLKGAKCINNCTLDKKPNAPGQKTGGRFRRVSDRGIQLREKQKARYSYGILEKQFRRIFAIAEKMPGVTGENLAVLLERRLDNVVYRLGFADSRAQARQLVRHGHIVLSGKRTNIPSCLVKEGDTVTWREESKNTEYFKMLQEDIKSKTVLNWLSVDREKIEGHILSLPTLDDVIDVKFEPQSIVEWYSR